MTDLGVYGNAIWTLDRDSKGNITGIWHVFGSMSFVMQVKKLQLSHTKSEALTEQTFTLPMT